MGDYSKHLALIDNNNCTMLDIISIPFLLRNEPYMNKANVCLRDKTHKMTSLLKSWDVQSTVCPLDVALMKYQHLWCHSIVQFANDQFRLVSYLQYVPVLLVGWFYRIHGIIYQANCSPGSCLRFVSISTMDGQSMVDQEITRLQFETDFWIKIRIRVVFDALRKS